MKYFDKKNRGKFIVFYGPNNIGKSTQISEVAARVIKDYHEQVMVIKYPIYELEPTGPMINEILRVKGKDRDLTEQQIQELYVKNRKDFQNTLVKVLNSGVHVIAEDYVGTGIAWGMTRGLEYAELYKLNEGLLVPDIEILLTGKRFNTRIEKNHRNESLLSKDIWEMNKKIYHKLAEQNKWYVVKTTTIVKTHEKIWELLQQTKCLPMVHKESETTQI